MGILTEDRTWVKEKVTESLWPNAVDTVDPFVQELDGFTISGNEAHSKQHILVLNMAIIFFKKILQIQ